jgi:hypothetical protein
MTIRTNTPRRGFLVYRQNPFLLNSSTQIYVHNRVNRLTVKGNNTVNGSFCPDCLDAWQGTTHKTDAHQTGRLPVFASMLDWFSLMTGKEEHSTLHGFAYNTAM